MGLKRFCVARVGAALCMGGALLVLAAGCASAASKGDQEALGEAQNYLSSEAFSLGGLISQLKFEGYTTAEATYGAENSGANWNKEALLSAKEYLGTEAFSMSGLIHQLEFSKFTASQASYGVARCGANWNTQAYKAAKEYLSTEHFESAWVFRRLSRLGERMESWKRSELDTRGIPLS